MDFTQIDVEGLESVGMTLEEAQESIHNLMKEVIGVNCLVELANANVFTFQEALDVLVQGVDDDDNVYVMQERDTLTELAICAGDLVTVRTDGSENSSEFIYSSDIEYGLTLTELLSSNWVVNVYKSRKARVEEQINVALAAAMSIEDYALSSALLEVFAKFRKC